MPKPTIEEIVEQKNKVIRIADACLVKAENTIHKRNQQINHMVNQLAACNKVLDQTASRLINVRGETQAVRDIRTLITQNDYLIEQAERDR